MIVVEVLTASPTNAYESVSHFFSLQTMIALSRQNLYFKHRRLGVDSLPVVSEPMFSLPVLPEQQVWVEVKAMNSVVRQLVSRISKQSGYKLALRWNGATASVGTRSNIVQHHAKIYELMIYNSKKRKSPGDLSFGSGFKSPRTSEVLEDMSRSRKRKAQRQINRETEEGLDDIDLGALDLRS